MALKLEIAWKGYTPDYWKINNMSAVSNSGDSFTEVTLALYKNKATKELDPIENKLLEKSYILSGVDYTRATAYTELKLLPEFSGAIDE